GQVVRVPASSRTAAGYLFTANTTCSPLCSVCALLSPAARPETQITPRYVPVGAVGATVIVKLMVVGVFAAMVEATGAGVIVTSCPLIALTRVTLLSAVVTWKVAASVAVTGVAARVSAAYEVGEPDGQVTRGVGARSTSTATSRSRASCIRGLPFKLATTCRSVGRTAIGASGSALMVNVTG